MGYWCVVTSLSFLAPSALCIPNKLYFESLMFVFMAFASSIYHIDEFRSEHMLIDMMGITMVLSYVIHITMEGLLFVNLLNLAAVVVGCVAFGFWLASPEIIPSGFEDIEVTAATLELYDKVHSVWHVLTSVAMTLIIYSYIQTNVKQNKSFATNRIQMRDVADAWTNAASRITTLRKNVDPWKLMTLIKSRKGVKGD